MANYNDAQKLLQHLKPIINQCIENHPSVKSSIKAKKATVESVDTAKKTVTVRFPFDTTLVTLSYNPQMESYLTTGTVKGKTVSVWFYQSLSNGIVMQDGAWGLPITYNHSLQISGAWGVVSFLIKTNSISTPTFTELTSLLVEQTAVGNIGGIECTGYVNINGTLYSAYYLATAGNDNINIDYYTQTQKQQYSINSSNASISSDIVTK